MEWNDWLLAFHLLSAFALSGAIILFWVVVLSLRRAELPEQITGFGRLMQVGTVVVSVGSLGAIIFGVWLAISLDAYQLWDGWVIAAIILWFVAIGVGKQAGDGYRATSEMAAQLDSSGSPRSPELAAAMGVTRAFWMHCISTLLIFLILVDMIWKPGA